MARIESLNMLLDPSGKDFLAELYGNVIANVQKGTISGALKNTNLSGNPESGTVEAKRLAFAKSNPKGTARAAGKGEAIKVKPVTVAIDRDRELVEEVQSKDIFLYGVEGLIRRRTEEHQMAMIRELESAFFTTAASVGATVTPTATEPLGILEELILAVETVDNDYVHGVPRNMISVIMRAEEYSKLRTAINTEVGNANVNSAAEEFIRINGVNVYSSIDIPVGTKAIAMCREAIAMPVLPNAYTAEKINLDDAYALELFYYYGVKDVMPDLIAKIAA